MRTNELRERVYLKILEYSDDSRLVSNEALRDICFLFEEFSYDAELSNVVKDVYKEIVKRSYKFRKDEVNDMENVMGRLTNLKALQFLPQVKKEVNEKNKSIDLNKMIREELEVDK